MSNEINLNRRNFIGTAAMTVATTHLTAIAVADGQSSTHASGLPPVKSGARASFGSLKQINAGGRHRRRQNLACYPSFRERLSR